MTDLVATVAKKEVPASANYVTFELTVNDEDGEDVHIPTVRLRIRN